ncbi:hypothetical protein ACFWZT_32915 [Streptomyces alboflavus]|uniref:hypothetical protein n=1 Tax=Streptomyces alboflavus TaxID=67267 RepID=UPI0036BA765E
MTADLRVGDIVVDVPRDRIVEVAALDGDELTVARPAGLSWTVRRQDCRPATAAEQRDFEIASRRREKSKSYTGAPSPLREDGT